MDCFGAYFTHAQTCDDVRVQTATQWTASVHTLHMLKPVMTFVFTVLRNGLCFGTYFKHAQTCDDVRVQSATQWTASVDTLNMLKPVMTFLFKVLRNGLLRSPLSGSKVHRDHLCRGGPSFGASFTVSHFALQFGLVGVLGSFDFLVHDTYKRSFQLALQFATGRVIHDIDLASSDNQGKNL